MNFKRAIAREWLLFLLVVVLSPMIVAVYHWTGTPNTSEDFLYENPRIYDLVILAPDNTQFRVDSSLPKVERDQAILNFIVEHSLKHFNYTLDLINPRTGKPYQIQSRLALTGANLQAIKKDLASEACKGDIFDKVACEEKRRMIGGDLPEGFVLISGFIPDSPKNGLVQIGQFLQGDYLGDDSRKLLQGIRANGFLTLKKRSLIGYLAAVAISPSHYYAFIVIYPVFLFLRSIVWSIRKTKER